MDIFPLSPALQGLSDIWRKLGLAPDLDQEPGLYHLFFQNRKQVLELQLVLSVPKIKKIALKKKLNVD